MPEFRRLPAGAHEPQVWAPSAVLPEDELAATQLLAWRVYFRSRDDGDDHHGALIRVLEEVNGDDEEAAGITLQAISQWAAAKNWEEAWAALLGAGTLTREELRAEVRLTQALDDRLKAHDVYLKAYVHVMDQKGGKGSTQQFNYAFTALQAANDAVTVAEEHLYRRALQQAPHPAWKQRRAGLVKALHAQYGELGPQYEILLYRLADAEVRCEQLTENGQVDGEEYARTTRTITELVAQLQRYTEATKTEIVDRARHEGVEAVLRLLQHRVLVDHPELMRRTVEVIKADLAGDQVLITSVPA